MTYRCEACRAASKPGEKRMIHVVTRARRVHGVVLRGADGRPHMEIAREVPLCRRCWEATQSVEKGGQGWTLAVAMAHGKAERIRWSGNVPKAVPRASLPPLALEPTSVPDDPAPISDTPRCDICGADAYGGQSTADSVLCVDCLRRAGAGGRGRARTASPSPRKEGGAPKGR